jgi:S-(hydroxymethyl)glutathione dehydrogenase/alcohol dehydrogenase
MRAALMDSVGQSLRVRELEATPPGPHEVVVRLAASGVCHTDLSVLRGALPSGLPAVLGHEGSGVVERVGRAVERVHPGDRVITCAAPACGRCYYCVRGEAQNCPQISELVRVPHFVEPDGTPVLGYAGLGTFAEVMTVHEASVVPVHTDLPPEQLALIGCGVGTGVGAVFNTARVEPGMAVAVIGCGGVGQSAVQAALLAGAACVIAVDPVDRKRESAKMLGASVAFEPGEGLGAVIGELTDGRGVDVAIEAVGSGRTISMAWDVTRRGGTVVIVGAARPDDTVTFGAADLALSRKTIKGSIFAGGDPHKLMSTVVALAESGRFDLASMISRTIRLEDLGSAFADMENGLVTRSVIIYD